MNELITGALFKRMVLHGAAAITAQKQAINDLNVFPVPDGDTGTNMSMTIGTAVTELRKSEPATVDKAASVTASALLRGARGNSGVILSLLFRGLSKGLKGMETAGAAAFAAAMQEGVSAAYKAVMKPAEGTVLTVSRLAAKRAVDTVAEGETDIEKVLEEALKEGWDALAQTTDMNPVLKKAGVVDAGGKGYLLILEGMLAELRGELMPEVTEDAQTQDKADFAALSEEDITFTFDTVFIVRKTVDKSLESFRAYLNSIGDSLVIGEDDEAFKVHVHTNIPGVAISESQKYGTLEVAKIENMVAQSEAVKAGKKAKTADDAEDWQLGEKSEPAIAEPEKEYGIVTVCAGSGMEDLFRELGADGIVTGGQTMNPSTDDILREINRTPASTVFVFPNNKNIIMAAEQCIPLTEKRVVVIPTKTVPQGVSALLNFNPDEGEAELAEIMVSAMQSVHTAMVTYAARDSDFDGHTIHAGEYLALLDGALLGSYTNIKTLFEELSWAFDEFSPEFITVYYGEDVRAADAEEAAGTITGCFPDAEVSVVDGGQPVYYYMISVE